MTLQEQFETLKCDYIQKSETHLKEMQRLHMDDFKQVTSSIDIVLTQHAASMSFLLLSMFLRDQKKKW